MVLETARLVLRELQADDAPFILRLLNEPAWLRYIGDKNVRTLDDARAYIDNGPRKMYAERGFGLWLVQRKDDGAAIGLCGLLKRDTLPDVDIGFALLPEHWRHGYALEAAAATLRHGAALGLRRIVAITSPDNLASGRLLEKLGLRDRGLVRLTPDASEVRLFAPPDRAADAA